MFSFYFWSKKYDHVSACLKKLNTLNMNERRLLHGLTLMHKINKKLAPTYLIDRIKHNADFHSYNTRNRRNITTERCNTTTRKNSFFPYFSKLYNEVTSTNHMPNLSIVTFKKHVKDYLKKSR